MSQHINKILNIQYNYVAILMELQPRFQTLPISAEERLGTRLYNYLKIQTEH